MQGARQQQPTVCSTEAPLYNLSSCPPKKRFRPAAMDSATTNNSKQRFFGIPSLPAKKRVQAFQFGQEQLLQCLLLQQDDGSNHHKPSSNRDLGTDAGSDPRPCRPCRFCHDASGDSEEVGPLMEYRDRVLVPAAQGSGCSNAICVHLRCAEWAPNVYYVTGNGGEAEEEEHQQQQIRNVRSEISRAHRLKCHACGARGAALGCCVKQCRKSFHYGCARQAEDGGRWETKEYLFLCSEHALCSFPGESPRDRSTKPEM